jgi:hypothetical protein
VLQLRVLFTALTTIEWFNEAYITVNLIRPNVQLATTAEYKQNTET